MCLLLLLQYHLQHPSFPLLNCNKIRSLSLQSKPRIYYHQQMGSTLEAPFLIWALLLVLLFLLRRYGLLLFSDFSGNSSDSCFLVGFMLARSLPIWKMGQLSCMQHQVHDAVEDSMPAGDSPYVLSLAHKMLKQKKLANIPSLWDIALSWEGDFTRSSNNTAWSPSFSKLWSLCKSLLQDITLLRPMAGVICQNCHHLWLITFKVETRYLLFQFLIPECLHLLFLS